MSSYLNLKQAAYNLNVLTNASYRGATVTICSKNPCCFKLSRNTDQNHDKVYRLAHQTLIRISKHSEGKEALLQRREWLRKFLLVRKWNALSKYTPYRLNDLDPDVLSHVWTFLNPKDLYQLSMVSKQCKQQVDQLLAFSEVENLRLLYTTLVELPTSYEQIIHKILSVPNTVCNYHIKRRIFYKLTETSFIGPKIKNFKQLLITFKRMQLRYSPSQRKHLYTLCMKNLRYQTPYRIMDSYKSNRDFLSSQAV